MAEGVTQDHGSVSRLNSFKPGAWSCFPTQAMFNPRLF